MHKKCQASQSVLPRPCAENSISENLDFKILSGSMPPDPSRDSRLQRSLLWISPQNFSSFSPPPPLPHFKLCSAVPALNRQHSNAMDAWDGLTLNSQRPIKMCPQVIKLGIQIYLKLWKPGRQTLFFRVTSHNFPCLILSCLLRCSRLMSVFLACFLVTLVRDLCRSGCRHN